jgi:hypothetical protein
MVAFEKQPANATGTGVQRQMIRNWPGTWEVGQANPKKPFASWHWEFQSPPRQAEA